MLVDKSLVLVFLKCIHNEIDNGMVEAVHLGQFNGILLYLNK